VLLQSLLILTNTDLLLRVFLLFFSETENLELALSSLALLGLVVSTVLLLTLVAEDMPQLLVLGLLSNILVTTDIWIRLERLLKPPEESPRKSLKFLNFKSSETLKYINLIENILLTQSFSWDLLLSFPRLIS